MVSPLRYGFFPQKQLFMEGNFGGNLWGGVLVRGGGSFIDAFSNNLNTLNLFLIHVWIVT